MKNLKILFSFFILLLFVSCQKSSRHPSSETSVFVSNFSPSEAISIYKSEDKLGDGSSFSLNELKKYTESRLRIVDSGVPGNKNVSAELIEKELPAGIRISFDVEVKENGKFIFQIFHHPDVDDVDIDKAYRFVHELISKSKLQTYFDLFEWFYNVRERDPVALHNMAKVWDEAAKKANLDNESKVSFMETREGITNSLDKEVKALNKERKVREKARKEIQNGLDKLADDKQLRSLVAAGKRVEAADLIEKYLPREQMAPFENKFWDETLEAMRNPVPMNEKIMVFRGVNGDMVYPAIEEGIELTKEQALKEDKIFTMSSVMTKNQGTWNRRLRSLQTMMDKFIGQHNTSKSSEFTRSFRVSTFFKQHSRNPQGSPFLSYTPKIGVATNFGSQRTLAYLIDPRSLLANYTSFYQGEFEFLSTLITFPDEMLSVYDSELHGSMSNKERKKFFIEALERKMIQEYGDVEGPKHFKSIKKTFDFYNEFDNLADLEKGEVAKKENIFKRIFQKIISFFKKKKPVEKVVEEVVEDQAKGCNYILKTIWNLN